MRAAYLRSMRKRAEIITTAFPVRCMRNITMVSFPALIFYEKMHAQRAVFSRGVATFKVTVVQSYY